MESLQPKRAVEMYLQERSNDVTEATLYSHKSRLSHFVDWCEEKELDDLNELSGRDLHEFKLHRRSSGINKVTEKTQLDTLRVFIRWCESMDAVPENLSQAVQSPDLQRKENVRDEILEGERAEQILEYLNKYEYASFRHVLFMLLFKCGMRIGGARATDVSDVDEENLSLQIEHRPKSDTPLKNQADGNRFIALSSSQTRVLEDYIEENRIEVEDEFNRRPQLSTTQGRAHTNTLRSYIYQLTRPCMLSDECPHGYDIDECEYNSWSSASSCPSSVSPHSVRRGSITHHLLEDVPNTVVSDRMNVGNDTLEKHYDRRSLEEKMEQRRDHLNGI